MLHQLLIIAAATAVGAASAVYARSEFVAVYQTTAARTDLFAFVVSLDDGAPTGRLVAKHDFGPTDVDEGNWTLGQAACSPTFDVCMMFANTHQRLCTVAFDPRVARPAPPRVACEELDLLTAPAWDAVSGTFLTLGELGTTAGTLQSVDSTSLKRTTLKTLPQSWLSFYELFTIGTDYLCYFNPQNVLTQYTTCRHRRDLSEAFSFSRVVGGNRLISRCQWSSQLGALVCDAYYARNRGDPKQHFVALVKNVDQPRREKSILAQLPLGFTGGVECVANCTSVVATMGFWSQHANYTNVPLVPSAPAQGTHFFAPPDLPGVALAVVARS